MEKWAEYLIYTVRYNKEPKRIASVKTHEDKGDKISSSDLSFTRDEVIQKIKNGVSFCTIYKDKEQWYRGRDVIVTSNNFIKTEPNEKEEDNLGELPEY